MYTPLYSLYAESKFLVLFPWYKEHVVYDFPLSNAVYK